MASADLREVWKRLGDKPWVELHFPPLEYTKLADYNKPGSQVTTGWVTPFPYYPKPSAMQGCKL